MKVWLPLFICLFRFLFAQHDTSIVAVVGSYKISANDLLTSFEFGPAFVKRMPDPLREHLKYMTYEYLLAAEGERQHLGESEFVKQRVQGLEEDNAVEQLYRQDILSKVILSEKQIEQDARSKKKNISFRWIFTASKDDAQKMSDRIAAFHAFDSLFALQLDSNLTAGDRSNETSLLKLERDNADLAALIKKLKPGNVSHPIEARDGYYIIKIDSLRQNPITTQTEYAELKNQAIEIRTKIEANKLADQYIKNLMDQNYPIMKAEGLNIVRAYLADKGLSHDTKVTWKIPSTFMTEAGPQPISNSGKYLQRTLVTFGKRSLQVRDYVDWYEIRQFQLDTRSEKAFTSSVKKTIWKMVQDRLLSQRAYERGLERMPDVIHEKNQWKLKLLYLAERSAVLRTMNLSDTVLHAYYMEHKVQFTDADGKIKKYADVKNEVKTDCYYSMEADVLLKKIAEIKKEIPVTVNEELLHRLSLNVQRDIHSIDAVFYKPGGTFPHVAFPTIDEAWSRVR